MTTTPLSIGSLRLDSFYILAPLAGYTDLAFRLLCREYGAGLVFSEMISCHGLVYGQKNTLVLLESHPAERPFGIQLFGADPEVMGKAAAIASQHPADLLDINMGCPVRKVTKRGSGSALMKTPDLARQIIQSVCANTHLPVTVKIRTGWTHETINAVAFAQMAQEAGASAITVHGRTWSMGFSGEADWDIIAQVKQAVTIPVIGNGDVLSYQEGLEKKEKTGCDGIMIGRGALGNPWVFSPSGRPDSLELRLQALFRYMELATEFMPTQKMLFRIKNHASRYFSELHGAGAIRKEINQCATCEDLCRFFKRIAQTGNTELM
ncbi:tRNA dihydrouridine synthase DusB [Desulfogranum japonicum]|uniref:tRNA dihydrouridine synthase DusB n=1 Tax=Desulfogranum japonicum TaxID=231447 RepID=UPI000553D7F5|nr:tRNA dihydrouridine synthase DusB [Desulfogranum japonicum]